MMLGIIVIEINMGTSGGTSGPSSGGAGWGGGLIPLPE